MFHLWHGKEEPRMEKFYSFFPKILLKMHFKWKFSLQMHTKGYFFQNQGTFFPKSGHFSSIFKKRAGEISLPCPPLVARLPLHLLRITCNLYWKTTFQKIGYVKVKLLKYAEISIQTSNKFPHHFLEFFDKSLSFSIL